jgi:tRNA 2-thiocytidine biosynthesis protein TtcA
MPASRQKRINRDFGKAIHQYGMIEDGDRICVGLSGGKDSLALMWYLSWRLARIPVTYSLFPCFIDPGFDNSYAPQLADFCRQRDWPLRIDYSDCGVVAHSEINRENPCFLCSRIRRKRLFEIAAETGCNKLALGHNKDDIIESLFLSICYAGEISAMNPRQPMFGGKITIIRPLAMVEEDDIKKFVKDQGFPNFENPCPTAKTSRRHTIKTLLEELYSSNEKVKGNIFRAMGNVRMDYLLSGAPGGTRP